jgi:hypothetical protein
MYTIPLSSSADDRIKTISCISSSKKTSMAFNAKNSVIDALAATGNDDTDIRGKKTWLRCRWSSGSNAYNICCYYQQREPLHNLGSLMFVF